MTTETKPALHTQTADACAIPCFNLELVQEITENLPDEQKIRAVAAFYGALADPTRLKILHALSKGELCVCDMAHVLCLSVSATSHQLRTLRNLNLVSFRNDGRMAYYSLPEGSAVQPLIESSLAR